MHLMLQFTDDKLEISSIEVDIKYLICIFDST